MRRVCSPVLRVEPWLSQLSQLSQPTVALSLTVALSHCRNCRTLSQLSQLSHRLCDSSWLFRSIHTVATVALSQNCRTVAKLSHCRNCRLNCCRTVAWWGLSVAAHILMGCCLQCALGVGRLETKSCARRLPVCVCAKFGSSPTS